MLRGTNAASPAPTPRQPAKKSKEAAKPMDVVFVVEGDHVKRCR